jgi:hypothetical protein
MKFNFKAPDDENFDFPEIPGSDPSTETNQEPIEIS